MMNADITSPSASGRNDAAVEATVTVSTNVFTCPRKDYSYYLRDRDQAEHPLNCVEISEVTALCRRTALRAAEFPFAASKSPLPKSQCSPPSDSGQLKFVSDPAEEEDAERLPNESIPGALEDKFYSDVRCSDVAPSSPDHVGQFDEDILSAVSSISNDSRHRYRAQHQPSPKQLVEGCQHPPIPELPTPMNTSERNRDDRVGIEITVLRSPSRQHATDPTGDWKAGVSSCVEVRESIEDTPNRVVVVRKPTWLQDEAPMTSCIEVPQLLEQNKKPCTSFRKPAWLENDNEPMTPSSSEKIGGRPRENTDNRPQRKSAKGATTLADVNTVPFSTNEPELVGIGVKDSTQTLLFQAVSDRDTSSKLQLAVDSLPLNVPAISNGIATFESKRQTPTAQPGAPKSENASIHTTALKSEKHLPSDHSPKQLNRSARPAVSNLPLRKTTTDSSISFVEHRGTIKSMRCRQLDDADLPVEYLARIGRKSPTKADKNQSLSPKKLIPLRSGSLNVWNRIAASRSRSCNYHLLVEPITRDVAPSLELDLECRDDCSTSYNQQYNQQIHKQPHSCLGRPPASFHASTKLLRSPTGILM
jgi:hypothetical protein